MRVGRSVLSVAQSVTLSPYWFCRMLSIDTSFDTVDIDLYPRPHLNSTNEAWIQIAHSAIYVSEFFNVFSGCPDPFTNINSSR